MWKDCTKVSYKVSNRDLIKNTFYFDSNRAL